MPRRLAYDKVIMQAGGIGYAKADQALKDRPETGDKIIILGGDNYRIGMGGAAVSSADTGEFSSAIELNAVQRSNPEMQKRAANAIRGMVESDKNSIVSIHDHGAGGHLNCLSELVEEIGGKSIWINFPLETLRYPPRKSSAMNRKNVWAWSSEKTMPRCWVESQNGNAHPCMRSEL